jgi:hypothetical protein
MADDIEGQPEEIYSLPDALVLLARLLSSAMFVAFVGLAIAIPRLVSRSAFAGSHSSGPLLLWIVPLAALVGSVGLFAFSFQEAVFFPAHVERRWLFRRSEVLKSEIASYRVELRLSPTGSTLFYELQLRSGFQVSIPIDPRDRDHHLDDWFKTILVSDSANSERNAALLARSGPNG